MRRLLLLLLLLTPLMLRAQPGPDLGGALYLDYAVRLVAPDTLKAGEAGFLLRRAHVAATFHPAARTTAHVRFEVDDRSVPAPRLYDAWLRLDSAFGGGHALTLGLLVVPEVTIAEDTWGYRVLERTLRDRAGTVDSRDLGVSFRGPLGGPLRYGLTLANGGSFRGPERRAGRLYGTLEAAPAGARLALSGDVGYREGRRLGAVNLLAALTPGRLRLGAEVFVETHEADGERGGFGTFWAIPLDQSWTFAGRADAVWKGGRAAPSLVAALGYRVNEALDVLPGVVAGRPLPGDDFRVTARVTMHARF
ncbi:MAG TPA: hypothetical protein VD948_02270 [Rhodothermales bacterium]|nr:hypothetical protein [Rhodothermales bacterium]